VKTIRLKPSVHKNKERLFLEFAYDAELITLAKTIQGILWSQTRKGWHMPASQELIDTMAELFEGKACIEYTGLNTVKINADAVEKQKTITEDPIPAKVSETTQYKLNKFINWMQSRRYSESTVKTYSESIRTFVRFYADKAVEDIDNDDLIRFNNEYILAKGYSSSFQNQVVYPVGFKK
jgi:integrase/recombinase XerD